MATLLLSLGVPMLWRVTNSAAGQHGNNNAYCQDNELTWLDWDNIPPEDSVLRRFVRYLITSAGAPGVFAAPLFPRRNGVGGRVEGHHLGHAGGIEATGEDWANPVAWRSAMCCAAPPRILYARRKARHRREFLVMLNAYHGELDFHFP